MKTLIAVFQLPIVVLNTFGFLVSGIWLLAIGQWPAVLLGLATAMFAPTLLGFALLPGMLIAAPGMFFVKRGVTIGIYFFALLSSIFTYTLISAWCEGITFYFLRGSPPGAFWPLLIWSYGVATSPWSYLAQRDGSPTSFLSAFFTQAAYIVMLVVAGIGDIYDAFQAFALVMLLGVITHIWLIAGIQREGAFAE